MFTHPLNTLDNVAFYWFGWKDYPFQYKPAFQIMKELYDEEKNCDVSLDNWYSTKCSQTYETDWIDTSIQRFVTPQFDDSYDDSATSTDDEGEVEDDVQDCSFYDQAIYKKFSYS